MALSKRTVNKHNIKRAEVFKANGLNILDIQYARPAFMGYGHGECILCEHKNLKWLFSIKFEKPQGLVALAKVGSGIDREDEVNLYPVGSKCITDWLDAVPETPEKLEALKRWDREMRACKAAMKAKVIEDLCADAGYATPEDAYQAYFALTQDHIGRLRMRRALRRTELTQLHRNAKGIRYKRCARKTAQDWLKSLDKVLKSPVPSISAPPPPVAPAPTPAAAPKAVSPADQALLNRGTASWVNKDVLPHWQQKAFQDIARKVLKNGGFVSQRQRKYYEDMLNKLEGK